MCTCDTRAARAHTPVLVGRPEADRPRCARRGIDQKAPPTHRPPDRRRRRRRRRQRCRVTSRAREKERPKRARDRTPSPHRRRCRRRGDDGRAFGAGVPNLPAFLPPKYLRWSAKGVLPPGEVVQALRFRRLDGLGRQSCGWAVGV